MQISTKGRYGMYALLDLAINSESRPLALTTIARRQGISSNYLEQVFASLRKADLVKSIKGPNGGYLLSRSPEEITLKEILVCLEGSMSVTSKDFEGKELNTIQTVIKEEVWDVLNDTVDQVLSSTTLKDLMEEYEKQEQSSIPMYYI